MMRGCYMYKLGIDVGGTNIDFAVLNQMDNLLFGSKTLADDGLSSSLCRGIKKLMSEYDFDPRQVSAIHLGTTLAVNSLLELKSLYKVGVIRLASHTPDLPPAYQWPKKHRQHILSGFQTVAGGREYNNAALSPLNKEALLHAVNKLIAEGAESLAIVGVFSPFYAEDELEAEAYIQAHFGEIPLSLSYQVGGIGFITRENSTILNATLKKVMKNNFHDLQAQLNNLGFRCPCYITQNDGTLLTLNEAIAFPVRTISSGPTNSIIGACHLADCMDGIVVDVGGTSTDIGLIQQGRPFYSLNGGFVSGISCQLLIPDVHVLAMGGGSIIKKNDKTYQIGPESVGAALYKKCRSVGGECLTLYDVGQVLSGAQQIAELSRAEAEAIMQTYLHLVKNEIERLLPDVSKTAILLVGGGAANIPDDLLDQRFIRPPHYQIANAYGAALSEVAGKIDCVVQFKNNPEEEILAYIEQAKMIAIKKGAIPDSLRIIEKKVLPLYYMPEPRQRVLITVSGRM